MFLQCSDTAGTCVTERRPTCSYCAPAVPDVRLTKEQHWLGLISRKLYTGSVKTGSIN